MRAQNPAVRAPFTLSWQGGSTAQPVLSPAPDGRDSLAVLSLQVSANLKLSEKQEVKKELVSAEEAGPRPPQLSPRWAQGERGVARVKGGGRGGMKAHEDPRLCDR